MEPDFKKPRKDFFIKKWLQFKFSLIFILVIIIGNVLFGSFVLKMMSKYLNYYLYTSHTKLTNTWDIIEGALLKTSLISIGSFIVLFILVIYFITRRLSHGFDIISDDLKAMNSGDLRGKCEHTSSKTTLNLFNDFNDVKCDLRTSINEAKAIISNFNTALEKFDNHASEKNREGVVETFKELESYNNELKNKLYRINT